MKKINSVLDERLEGELLKVERNGCWGAFWGLLAAIAPQKQVFAASAIDTMKSVLLKV